MSLMFLIAFCGSSFLYYRYRLVSNKALFFQSQFFRGFACSVFIVLLAIGVVNLFGKARSKPDYKIAADSLTDSEADTSAVHLANQPPGYHYVLLQKLNTYEKYEPYLDAVQNRYKKFVSGNDPYLRDLGHFGIAALATLNDSYEAGFKNLKAIADEDLPYLHFLKGELLLENGDVRSAENEFQKELRISNGNFKESCVKLIDLYSEKNNFIALRQLLRQEPAGMLFPEHLARKALLYTGDVGEYLFWLGRSVNNQVNFLGLIAAVAISIVWLLYLVHLDIFRGNRVSGIMVMFVTGFLSVFMVISFNDLFDLVSTWSRNGDFINDFFYCLLMIAVPEELTKIFPLLVLLVWVRRLKEPLDYILFASASALGFGFIENLLYFQDLTDGIIHGRAYLAAIGHMVDSSLFAYGFVVSRFQLKGKATSWITVPIAFGAAVFSHGIYDFLLYQDLLYPFFIFFIFIIQVWIIIINNCLNNAGSFSYRLAGRSNSGRLLMALALTSIFALEYILIGFSASQDHANHQFVANAPAAFLLIIFFSSNLSSFDVVQGYWANVTFTNKEKLGHGSRRKRFWLVNLYFINAVNAHNYVGKNISLTRNPCTRHAADFLNQSIGGKIINRVILFENTKADPHWFLVKLDAPIPFASINRQYVLISLRCNEDSLAGANEVQVLLKGIPDTGRFSLKNRQKKEFPSCGLVYAALQSHAKI
jgi:RsiW-degrading membrane proteinase PrsW (M82 family)